MPRCLLYVGTRDGVFVHAYDPDGSLTLVGRGLAGNAVRAIAVHPHDPQLAYVGCGLRGWGLHRTHDAGRSFEPVAFADRWVWDVTFQPDDPETLWVGTEPPMLHITHDGGRSFAALTTLDRLPSRPQWHFFHPPFEAGHIHGIAIDPTRPERLFAAVEVGALVYTHDGGRTWWEALAGHDLHRLAIDPTQPDRVLAGALEGLFVSPDGGSRWEAVPALRGKYVHSVLFDARLPGRVYLYVFEEGAPLYRSDDGGNTWQQVGRGLPSAKSADPLSLHPDDPRTLFSAADEPGGGSRLLASTDAGEHWHPVSEALPKIWRVRAAGLATDGA